ncbi:MAG: hypothetical protein NTZ61_19085 [Proteobacteria bacterium]|nr:hypothetical protein [Pseudomonadota bacterium]
MQSDEPGAANLPEQQRRDVAIAGQRLRRGARGGGVEAVDDAVAAVAAARAQDRVDARVGPEFAQLGSAPRVVTGQVAVARTEIVATYDCEARLAPALLRRFDQLEIHRAGGRSDTDRPAAGQRARLTQRCH